MTVAIVAEPLDGRLIIPLHDQQAMATKAELPHDRGHCSGTAEWPFNNSVA